MKTWIVAFTLVFAFPLAGLASDKSPSGVSRPGLSTNPRGYLRNFPLGKVPADEVIQYVGTPDKSYTLAGRDYIAYDIEPKQGNGKIEYTYIVKDGVVVDVTYLNSGNFFGVTQRESASELQGEK